MSIHLIPSRSCLSFIPLTVALGATVLASGCAAPSEGLEAADLARGGAGDAREVDYRVTATSSAYGVIEDTRSVTVDTAGPTLRVVDTNPPLETIVTPTEGEMRRLTTLLNRSEPWTLDSYYGPDACRDSVVSTRLTFQGSEHRADVQWNGACSVELPTDLRIAAAYLFELGERYLGTL